MIKNSLVNINNYESYLYFFAWLCSIVYAVYQLYLSNSYFDNYYDAYDDFNSGWTWIGKKRDISDQEWRVWLTLVNRLMPCVFIHHFISQIVKTKNTLQLVYFVIFSFPLFLFGSMEYIVHSAALVFTYINLQMQQEYSLVYTRLISICNTYFKNT